MLNECQESHYMKWCYFSYKIATRVQRENNSGGICTIQNTV